MKICQTLCRSICNVVHNNSNIHFKKMKSKGHKNTYNAVKKQLSCHPNCATGCIMTLSIQRGISSVG